MRSELHQSFWCHFPSLQKVLVVPQSHSLGCIFTKMISLTHDNSLNPKRYSVLDNLPRIHILSKSVISKPISSELFFL
jgi:hypothetical protein